MAQPAAPTVSNTTGTLASGTYFYQIQPVDANGTLGTPSPISSSCASNGSQACVVTWAPVAGQTGAYVCRGSNPGSMACDQALSDGMPIPGASFTDNLASFHYSASVFSGNGGSSVLGASGVATNALVLTGGGFKSAISGSFTAVRTQTLPDNTGIIPVTSYLNSAYDNANRANGAIGANWSVTNNGINISSNNFIGTAGANDVAFWSANPFSNVQFSQATITALNGTTDFPGVAVLLSGSGGSTQGYECVEDTTNIFIQRISGTSNTTLTSAATTGALGDVLRLEVNGGNLTCYKNGVSTLTTSDTTYTSGAPGLFLFGTVATEKNWSGGNLHPLHQMDVEADFTKVQHMNAGIGMGLETFTASPRAEQNIFLPGALTSTWTGSTWTLDKAITVTRLQAQAKTAPAGCTTNAVVRLTDGTSPLNVTISAAANDSGPASQNYAAGASLQLLVQTAAAGCTTSPADVNVIVQYRMQ
jgi:hypothetical protein